MSKQHGFFRRNASTLVKGALLFGAIALAASSDSYGTDELTNGQELDLSEALDDVQWNFSSEIESAYACGDSVTFYLVNGGSEIVSFSYSNGSWSAYSGDSQAVSDAVDDILSKLNSAY